MTFSLQSSRCSMVGRWNKLTVARKLFSYFDLLRVYNSPLKFTKQPSGKTYGLMPLFLKIQCNNLR